MARRHSSRAFGYFTRTIQNLLTIMCRPLVLFLLSAFASVHAGESLSVDVIVYGGMAVQHVPIPELQRLLRKDGQVLNLP